MRTSTLSRLTFQALTLVSASLCIIALSAVTTTAASQEPALGPLIRQIFIDPTGPDFVEIDNTGSADAPMGDLYLATVPDYYRVVLGEFAAGAESDFLVRFPAGASIPARTSAVVLLDGTVSEFRETYGFAPPYAIGAVADDETTAMEVPAEGGHAPTAGLSVSEGLLVLFYWDGESDLVEDSDIVMWGAGSERVDKTGVTIDGPDADADASAYREDTAAALQHPATVTEGLALMRAGSELAEERNGNGIDGEDETSENLEEAFEAVDPAPRLYHSIQVAGHVVPGERSPSVASLTVEFVDDTDLVLSVATTDEAGAYELTLPAGATFRVFVRGDTVLTSESAITTGAHDMLDVDFVADGLLPITGEVVAADRYAESAIAGLTVSLSAEGRSVVLDESGTFELPVHAQGDYVVSVTGHGIAPVEQTVEVGSDGVEDFLISVSSAFTVTGSVVDPEGAPVEGAAVTLVARVQQAETDAAGGFAFREIPPGVDTIRVEAEGFLPFEATIDIRSDITLDAVLERPGALTLSIQISTSDGASAEGTEVTLTVDGEDDPTVAYAGPDGDITFSNLLVRNYRLEINRGGYRPLTIDSVPLGVDNSLSVLLVSIFRQPSVAETGCTCSSVAPRSTTPGGAAALAAALVAVALSRRRR